MEHVNDDMDNLFRKAGELYPLKTSESDWEGVAGKLRDEISGEKGIPYAMNNRGNSNRRRWLLLLLVPAFIFSLIYFSKTRSDGKYPQSASKTEDRPDGKSEPVSKERSDSRDQTNKKSAVNSAPLPNSTKAMATDVPISADKNQSDNAAGHTNPQRILQTSTHNRINSKTGKWSGIEAGGQTGATQIKNPADPESFHEPVEKAVPLSVYSLNENPSVYGMPFPPSAEKNVTLNAETANATAKTKSNQGTSSKGFYAVLLGGPDWSTVKLQSTEQAGYSLGILLGYRFSKRISVETGLLWDKKNYYSDGQYFDKSIIYSTHPIDKIMTVDGYCNMFEIPLNLSYSFASRNNHGFFVTTGLSSYIMKKEYYNYEALGSSGNTWPGNSTYLNSSKNLFSILQISGGYEYSIGKNTNIRIEPYVKIPLGGIGIGNMPISSMGLYFGISHLFH